MRNWFEKQVVSAAVTAEFIRYFAKGDNWHKQDLKTGNLGYGWIHYGLLRALRPQKILCIGSRYGFIPAVCALAAKDNGRGTVDFVDAGFDSGDYQGPGEHWGGVGFWKKCDPKKYFGRFGLQNRINLFVQKSADYRQEHPEEKYGYIYLDGDHSYDGVRRDFEMFWPALQKKGFLAIHDIGSPDRDGNKYGTRKFWRELKRKYPVALEFLEDPGVGILEKL